MGNKVQDFAEFVRRRTDSTERLGDAIGGTFADVEVDSVEAVRDLRRRT